MSQPNNAANQFNAWNEARGKLVDALKSIPANPNWGSLINIKDSGERQTFPSGAMRDPSTGKIKWSRVTFGPMLRRWAQHLTNAEAKYPDPKPGVPNFTLIESEEERLRYKESALRHFMSWFYEETDEDHASAVFFNINGVEIIKDKMKARASAEAFKEFPYQQGVPMVQSGGQGGRIVNINSVK